MIASLRAISRRLAGMVLRGQVSLAPEQGSIPRIQARLRAGEVRSLIEMLEHYGLAYRPLEGAEVVVVDLGGGDLVSVGSQDRRYRPSDLAPGEVCIYDAAGSEIRLRQDGSIRVAPAGGTCTVAGSLVVTGSIEAAGDVSDALGSMQEMRDVYNIHRHGGTQPPDTPMI